VSNLDVLLIEDEDPKQRHILAFLQENDPPVTVRLARSVNAALDALEVAIPDLMLLDMSLPTFDVSEGERGGRPQGFGGLEIVRTMSMSGWRCSTLIVTGYEAFPSDSGEQVQLAVLESELAAVLGQQFLGVLHFNSALDEWKTELQSTIRSLGRDRTR
jgi:CheY-like chemotaxis protein